MGSICAEAGGGPLTPCTWWPRGGADGGMKLSGPCSEGPALPCSNTLCVDTQLGGGGGGGRRVGACGGSSDGDTNL
jgi:hypothetical protein